MSCVFFCLLGTVSCRVTVCLGQSCRVTFSVLFAGGSVLCHVLFVGCSILSCHLLFVGCNVLSLFVFGVQCDPCFKTSPGTLKIFRFFIY